MLDKYIWGDVLRISPEAPVQVVHVQRETYSPGGAANVAANAAALGANVSMVGLIGADPAAEILIRDLQRLGVNTDGIVLSKEVSTIQKVRIVGKGQQLLRIDYENVDASSEHAEGILLQKMQDVFHPSDAVIISDYAKGMVSEKVCRSLIDRSNAGGKIVVVDPKPKHRNFYSNATVLTPNFSEAVQMVRLEAVPTGGAGTIGAELVRELNANVLITLGENGMCLCEKSGAVSEIPPRRREVYSLVGAGDTVVACLTLALSAGSTLVEAAGLANIAAAIKVGKLGTATVTPAEIIHEINTQES